MAPFLSENKEIRPVDSGSAGLTDFQQDDLVINMVLTLGADAASSSLSSNYYKCYR